jgi:DNA-binding transcriptional regulator YhcF (GntR family)
MWSMPDSKRKDDLKPDLDNNRPLFLQVKEAIEDDILIGRLLPDEQIPSNSQLVEFFGLNPVTVHKSVSQLAEEGIVYKRRGLGMFVEPEAPKLLRARRQGRFGQEYVGPVVERAKILGMSSEQLRSLIEDAWRED